MFFYQKEVFKCDDNMDAFECRNKAVMMDKNDTQGVTLALRGLW